MFPSILAEADLPHVIGLTIGVAIFYVLPLFGLVGIFPAMRHRDASRKALLGLALMVGVYLSFMTYGLVLTWRRQNGSTPNFQSPVEAMIATGVFKVLLMVMTAAVVLAVLGIIKGYRNPERYRRGRRRGYPALTMAAGRSGGTLTPICLPMGHFTLWAEIDPVTIQFLWRLIDRGFLRLIRPTLDQTGANITHKVDVVCNPSDFVEP